MKTVEPGLAQQRSHFKQLREKRGKLSHFKQISIPHLKVHSQFIVCWIMLWLSFTTATKKHGWLFSSAFPSQQIRCPPKWLNIPPGFLLEGCFILTRQEMIQLIYHYICFLELTIIFTIWLFNTLPWKDPPFLTTVNHLFLWAIYTMAMLGITRGYVHFSVFSNHPSTWPGAFSITSTFKSLLAGRYVASPGGWTGWTAVRTVRTVRRDRKRHQKLGCVFSKPWESLVKTEMKNDEKGFAFRSKEAGIGNLPEMDGIHTKSWLTMMLSPFWDTRFYQKFNRNGCVSNLEVALPLEVAHQLHFRY